MDAISRAGICSGRVCSAAEFSRRSGELPRRMPVPHWSYRG